MILGPYLSGPPIASNNTSKLSCNLWLASVVAKAKNVCRIDPRKRERERDRERETEYEKSCKEKRKVIIMLLLDANYFACKQTDYIKSGSNKKKNSWLLFPQTLEERNYSKS